MANKKDTTCLDLLKQFDFYKDLPRDLAEPTNSGAGISLIVMAIMGLLLLQETWSYVTPVKTSEIVIDVKSSGEEKLGINLNISLPRVPCEILSLDVVDVTGVHVVDVGGQVHKHRLDRSGNILASESVLGHHDDID